MQMRGRQFSAEDYRYGFQGQEADDEIRGEGNSVNYKYRMHDPRIGRFLSLDPLAPKYPHNSPYAFSENRVIDGVELEGLEFFDSDDRRIIVAEGKVTLDVENFTSVRQRAFRNSSSKIYTNFKGDKVYGIPRVIYDFGIFSADNLELEYAGAAISKIPSPKYHFYTRWLKERKGNEDGFRKEILPRWLVHIEGKPNSSNYGAQPRSAPSTPIGVGGKPPLRAGIGIGLASFVQATMFVITEYEIRQNYDDSHALRGQSVMFEATLSAIQTELIAGNLPNWSLDDVSSIIDIMLFGETDYSVSPELWNTAARIFNSNIDAFNKSYYYEMNNLTDGWGLPGAFQFQYDDVFEPMEYRDEDYVPE